MVTKPKKNLSTYTQRYSDVIRLLRLKFIAQVCPKQRVEALELAIHNVKSTYNIKMYEELHKTLAVEVKRSNSCDGIAPSSDEAAASSSCGAVKFLPYDTYWVEDNSMESTLLLQELDAELKYKKSNSGSTYVRRILEEIGDYHVKTGNLQLAVKFYARTRPYCTSTDHVISMFHNLIKVSIYMANWWHVLSYIDEVTQYSSGFPNLAQTVPSRLSCAAGLANIGLKNFKMAAHHFLLTPFEGYEYDNIVAPQDVPYYAGLCGMATLEIDTLKKGCFYSDSFKQFFALSHKMWQIISNFVNYNFDQCRKMLHDIENHVRLDIYLAPHVDALSEMITARMLEKQCSPGTPVPFTCLELINELEL